MNELNPKTIDLFSRCKTSESPEEQRADRDQHGAAGRAAWRVKPEEALGISRETASEGLLWKAHWLN